jgi:hypothetical protein
LARPSSSRCRRTAREQAPGPARAYLAPDQNCSDTEHHSPQPPTAFHDTSIGPTRSGSR